MMIVFFFWFCFVWDRVRTNGRMLVKKRKDPGDFFLCLVFVSSKAREKDRKFVRKV